MGSAPPRSRSFGSRATWLRVAFAALVVALLWSAAWFYVPPIVAAQAKQAARTMLGRELTIGRVTFQPWTLELTIADAALAGATAGAPPLLEVRRLYADVAAVSLLRLAPVIDGLGVDAPMPKVITAVLLLPRASGPLLPVASLARKSHAVRDSVISRYVAGEPYSATASRPVCDGFAVAGTVKLS